MRLMVTLLTLLTAAPALASGATVDVDLGHAHCTLSSDLAASGLTALEARARRPRCAATVSRIEQEDGTVRYDVVVMTTGKDATVLAQPTLLASADQQAEFVVGGDDVRVEVVVTP